MIPLIASSPTALILTAIAAYMLGSIPFGVVITRAMGLGNLREIGSGNIGATNVLRTGNKRAAAATLILDAAKGGVAVLVARTILGEDAAQLAGLMAFLGHLFPVWLGFRGGKGVATFFGTLLALAWPVGLAACATWAASAALTRISSFSALIAAALAAPIAWAFGYTDMTLLILILAALVALRHHANIMRLLAGTEPRIGRKA
jgi:acyl phosphate:glycerol-3-phosphate acyltransferase